MINIMNNNTTLYTILVDDTRCGDSGVFHNLNAFRSEMLSCGWTSQEFQNFMADEQRPPEIYEIQLVRNFEDSGLYECKLPGEEGSIRYGYYRVWAPLGEVDRCMVLDHQAREEELKEAMSDD